MMTDFNTLKKQLLSNEKVKLEYDRLGPEFEIVRKFIMARSKAKMTQEQVAKAMGKSQPYVARLESGKSNPSIETIRQYAKATKQKIVLEVMP